MCFQMGSICLALSLIFVADTLIFLVSKMG
jgi:hypothetical protein